MEEKYPESRTGQKSSGRSLPRQLCGSPSRQLWPAGVPSVRMCGLRSLVGSERGKQENHQLEKLFTPDYDHHKASEHFIKSSLPLSFFTIIGSPLSRLRRILMPEKPHEKLRIEVRAANGDTADDNLHSEFMQVFRVFA